MLYRIQSLYIIFTIFLYSISIYLNVDGKMKITKSFFLKENISSIFIFICLLFSFISFFLFKNRKIQIKINNINIIIDIINFFIKIYFSLKMEEEIKKKTIILLIILLVCLFFLYKINKFIREDIKIIDSMNRIR